MSGVKGRSGRKSQSDESRRLRVIELAWKIAEEKLLDPKFSDSRKMELIGKIITKSIPQEILGDGLVKNYVQIYRPEYKTQEEIEANTIKMHRE